MSPSGFDVVDEHPRLTSMWVVAAMGLVSVLLWNMPFFGLALYPFKLFVTFLHESSHGLAAILTGGRLSHFTVSVDTSGLAYTRGGFRPLILFAGYGGSCLWGGLLLMASRRQGWEKAVLFALGGFMLAFSLLYVRSLMGLAVGLGFGAFFLWAARHGQAWQLRFLLAFLAVQSSFYAVSDLWTVVILTRYPVVTDAVLMSRELTLGLVPPIVFALGIAVAALVTFAFFLYLAVKPAKGS